MSILQTNSVAKSSRVPPAQTENIHQLLSLLERTQNYSISKVTLGKILDHSDSFLEEHMSELVQFFKNPRPYYIETPNHPGIRDMRSELFDEISKRCPLNFTARTAAMKIFKHLYDNNGYLINGKTKNEQYFFLLAFTCIKDINADETLKDELTREGIDFPKVLEYLVTKGYAKLVLVNR